MPSWIICLGPKICQFIKLIQCQVPTQYLVRLVRLNRFQIIVQVSHFSKEALMQDNPSSSLFLSVLQKKYAGPIPQPPSTTYQIFSNTNDIYLVRDQQNLSLLFEEEEEKKNSQTDLGLLCDKYSELDKRNITQHFRHIFQTTLE